MNTEKDELKSFLPPVASPVAFVTSATAAESAPRFTVREVLQHSIAPLAWKSLPDGTPLTLTAAAMEFLLDDFGGHDPELLRSAHRVLYFASRTPEELAQWWTPENGERCLALSMERVQSIISTWAAETWPVGTEDEVKLLATALWNHAALLIPVSAEKKNPPAAAAPVDSSSHGSGTSAGLWAAAPSAGSFTLGSTPLPPPSSPPSSATPTPMATP